MTQLLSYRFRSELARDFHRNITNTQTTTSFATPAGNTVFVYTAGVSQTTYSGADTNSNTLSYTPGRIAVYVNGVQLTTSQYTATNGTSVILSSAPTTGHDVVIITYNILSYPNPLDYYYVFLGRTTAWTNDSSPPTPTDTRETEAQTRRDIMAVKRVQPNDAILLVENNVWTTGTTYVAYDSDVVLQNLTYDYYVQHQYRIYKCVKAGASTSTSAPTHTGVAPVSYADGYHWQFLYEIPHGDRKKFMDNLPNSTYIPVRFVSNSSAFDHNGVISAIEVENVGSGYSIATPPTITILGDGTGATATAIVNGIGEISGITVTNGGQNYSYAIVSITDPSGSGATATASIVTGDVPNPLNIDVAVNAELKNGAIQYVNIVSGGSGYTAGASITVDGDGTGFSATVGTVNGSGAITSLTISDAGSGYTYATLTPAGGANASLQAIITPQGGHGSDVPAELLSRIVGIVVSFEDVADDFFLNNDFRQFGLIKNINKYDGSMLFSSDTAKATYVITVTNNSTISVDDLMTTAAGGKFRVVSKIGTTKFTLQPIIDSTISVNTVLTRVLGGTFTPTEVTSPEIDVQTGDLVYTKNVTPITRAAGQLEKVKLFFSF